jgi:hypothetical protein
LLTGGTGSILGTLRTSPPTREARSPFLHPSNGGPLARPPPWLPPSIITHLDLLAFCGLPCVLSCIGFVPSGPLPGRGVWAPGSPTRSGPGAARMPCLQPPGVEEWCPLAALVFITPRLAPGHWNGRGISPWVRAPLESSFAGEEVEPLTWLSLLRCGAARSRVFQLL